MKKVTQRFIIILAPLIVILLLGSMYYERSYYEREKSAIIESEVAYVNEQKAQINKIFPLIVSDLDVLTDLQEIHEFSNQTSASDSLAALEQKLVSFITFKRYYDQIRVLDAQGLEQVRVNRDGNKVELVKSDQLQDKSNRFYFSEVIKMHQGDTYVSPFDLNVEHGVIEQPLKPIIRFAVPILNDENETTGVLILNYLGARLIEEMERTTMAGARGNLMLVNQDGYWLKGLEPEDEWGFLLPERADQTIAQKFPDVWETISTQSSGQIETDDGLFTFTTLHPLHEEHDMVSAAHWSKSCGDWTLLSYVDQAFLTNQMLSVRMQIILFNLGVLMVLAAGAWWLARIQTGYRTSQQNLSDALTMINQLRESLNNGFVRYDIDGRIIDFNQAYQLMFGYEAKELKGMMLSKLTAEPSIAIEENIFEHQVMVLGHSDVYEKESIRKDGSHFPIEKRSFVSRNEQGDVESIWAIVSDISQRKEYEEKLRLLASVFENTIEGIMITDLNGTIEEINPGFSAITGYSSEDVVGQKTSILKSQHHDQKFYETMWKDITEKGRWSGEIWNRRKNGESFPQRLSISAVMDYRNQVSHFISVCYDISDIKHGERQLRHQAYHDALTGLPNRLLFLDRLKTALQGARRHQTKLAVLFLDMDNFKTINDSLGHNVGDRFLQKVASILKDTIRDEDTVARFGGDEFVILAPLSESKWSVCEIAKRIQAAFYAPLKLGENELYASFSMGISLYPNDGDDAESLTKNADLAMYQAKDQGKNSYHLYKESMNTAVTQRLDLQNSLRRALEHEEFEVFYQPKVSIDNGKITGCEALLRWRRNGEVVSPADFIPIAEETGLIIPIGEWVLRTACRDAQSWQQRGHPLSVAVNLSPRQFHQANLVPMILATLEETGLSPSLLELEITEGIVMDNVQETIATLKILREKGIHFSIDDFGTGYSSLQYLRQLPLDTLKIDRAFIKDLPENNEDAAITIATLSMAHALKLNVVAEGVETQSQLEFLRTNHCEQLQGYFFSRPLPESEFFSFLDSGRKLTDAES